MHRRKKKLFISHCSSDAAIMQRFTDLIDETFKNTSVQVFNTFNEETGTDAGEDLSEALRNNLTDSDVMIAVITDNYMRSVKCFSEFSVFWYLSRTIIPIVFNGQQGKDFVTGVLGKEPIFLDPISSSGKDNSIKLYRTLQNLKLPTGFSREEFCERFSAFFDNARQTRSVRPYIGSKGTFEDIVLYCNDNGIEKIADKTLGLSSIMERLRGCNDVFVVSTTGANLISGLSTSFLEEELLAGNNFTLLLPNKFSAFLADVAEIESPNDIEGNTGRLANAFDDIMTNLQRCVDSAAVKANGRPIGHVCVGCAYTLLRQTITIGLRGSSYWGWLSVTVPPSKTNDKTPSFSFSGDTSRDMFGSTILAHVASLRSLAEKRGDLHELVPNGKKPNCFYLEPHSAKQYWKELQASAKSKQIEHISRGKGILIEAAAKHPLVMGRFPDAEFSERLNYAAELYHRFRTNEKDLPVMIYVPGSRHRSGTMSDCVSLSAAGREYLLEKGIPSEDVLGDEENRRYKGDDGVYNSADECFVASGLYNERFFKKLCCVCSPGQAARKQLFYLAFGVIPEIYTVPCDDSAHDFVYELLEAVPDVIYRDHTWQDKDSPNRIRTRNDRIPE